MRRDDLVPLRIKIFYKAIYSLKKMLVILPKGTLAFLSLELRGFRMQLENMKRNCADRYNRRVHLPYGTLVQGMIKKSD
jgi:hypothetical protein